MNHPFTPSQIDSLICSRCKHDQIAHSDQAECEVCNKIGIVELYTDMLFCASCVAKEQQAQIELKANENKRVIEYNNSVLARAREIDSSIRIKSDLFNASTVSIVDMKKAIDNDSSIENKNFRLAEELSTRFKHLRAVLFEIDEKRLQISNEQHAIQVYLNNLASNLRAEERDKIKLRDINYQPTPPKVIKPRVSTVKRKFDKVELRKYAAEIGVSEFTLQMIVIQKNLSVEDAAKLIKVSLDAARGKS